MPVIICTVYNYDKNLYYVDDILRNNAVSLVETHKNKKATYSVMEVRD